jgi:flagellar biosynthesis protein FlhB
MSKATTNWEFIKCILTLAFLVVAIADLFYQRHSYTKSLMMTEEVKREYEESEGDPRIKARTSSSRMN